MCALVVATVPAGAQERPPLHVKAADVEWRLHPAVERGYAAIPAAELARLGWGAASDGRTTTLQGPDAFHVVLQPGSPFFRWNDEVLQFADPPYLERGELRVPLQFATDFLPARLPEIYAFDAGSLRLEYAGYGLRPVAVREDAEPVPAPAEPAVGRPASGLAARGEPGPPAREETVGPAPAEPGEALRVVVIDPGHGGDDPGSISRSGVREKTVALGVSLALARALERRPDLEVHLLRDGDRFVPLWDRGTLATGIKGDRPGIFVSVHANSFNSPARGFETYFLSDARTEHERRVAAIENAPLGREEEERFADDGDLDFILRELKNLDTQHWSALLAEMVQDEVDVVHPGPNRGVKQAPLAVITNALMPAVLVEVGYLSHPEEARLLDRPDFQERMGAAIARAVVRFFERYPPGTGGGSGAQR